MPSVIGVFAPLFPPAKNGGGPIRTLEALVAAAPADFRVSVLTGDRDLGETERLSVPHDVWLDQSLAEVYYASADSMRGLFGGFRALRERRPDILYFNGYFDQRFSILPQLMWRVGYWGKTVRLLAPRGEFGAGALSRRRAKKWAYIALYRFLHLHRGLYWHASSEHEAADIRQIWGNDARILVRENETLLPERARVVDLIGGDLAKRPLRAAFLGRIVEHKGLHLALQALRQVTAPIEFDVYGPAEDKDYVERCRSLIGVIPSNVRVRLRGSLEPSEARATLARYDTLLMPTSGENFGHVIAESLSVACPVVCSPHTPWTETLEHGGGAVLPLSVSAWSNELERQASLSNAQRIAARRAAGAAYDQWRANPAMPHVFELLQVNLPLSSKSSKAGLFEDR